MAIPFNLSLLTPCQGRWHLLGRLGRAAFGVLQRGRLGGSTRLDAADLCKALIHGRMVGKDKKKARVLEAFESSTNI